MSEPVFITETMALGLHRVSLELHGGLDGIRDRNAFHLAEAQAFLDGNKRVGVACAATFLLMNGHRDESDDDVIYEAIIAIACRKLDKAGLAALLRTQFPVSRDA